MSQQNPHMELDPKYDHYDYPTTAPEQQSGHPGHTTKEQDAAVHQLRMSLEQKGYHQRLDTLTMLRFLRARKFNVQMSEQMFLDCEKWRKEFGGGVDHLVREFDYKEKPQVMKYYPQYYHKIDKEGRPVYIEQLGNVDLDALRKITTDERMLQNLVVEYEKVADPRLPACSRKAGQLLETCCTIMDLKGVGLGKANQVYGYLQRASGISQNYYPERLGKLYVINAPWGFSTVFAVVKRFLDPVTVNKIHVYGSSYKNDLLAQVPAENLPKAFGGTCECAEGCQLSDDGPWKDSKYSKTPEWAKTDADGNEIPTTESHTGEGMPANADGKAGGVPQPAPNHGGQPAPGHVGGAPAPAPQ